MNLPANPPFLEGSVEEQYLMEAMRIAYNSGDLDTYPETAYGAVLPEKNEFDGFFVVRFAEKVKELWVVYASEMYEWEETVSWYDNAVELGNTIYERADEPRTTALEIIQQLRELSPRKAYNIEEFWGPEMSDSTPTTIN